MVISKLQPRVSGFFHVAWLCVSAAMAVVGLVNGVFVMIQELCTGEFYVESGGITVYFVSACRSDNFGRPYHLLGRVAMLSHQYSLMLRVQLLVFVS